MRDYKQDIFIDQSNLGDEWLYQGSLYTYWTEKLADAILERDRAKQKVEVTEAKVNMNYRSNWEELCTGIKMTDKAINCKVLLDKEYIEAVEVLHKAVHTTNILTKACIAFDHRKKSLENLVSLHLHGLLAEPQTPRKIFDDLEPEDTVVNKDNTETAENNQIANKAQRLKAKSITKRKSRRI